ncbi:MAG: type II toxin-antitoxin system RelE/ParE family toxin [Nostoc sp. LLA-1]|nr:type II toxin-antitoxin system RelE/ParE family toxin [Cyanocohniella sp. LLY]
MADQVVWSKKALEDVEAIATYISRDSVSYTATVVQEILDVTRHLNESPFSGRVAPEFSEDNIREKLAYSYRIIYRIQDDTVTIAAVIYGKRLVDQLDSDR